MTRPTPLDLMQILGLKPLPEEGGFFAETYRSPENVDARGLMRGYTGSRSLSTAIYYLLTPQTFSAMHHLPH